MRDATQIRAGSQRAARRPERSPEDVLLVQRFKELTEAVLPAQAAANHWPIRLDHCFKRICLDHAFNDVWYRHLPRPAERHLAGPALRRAVQCAEELNTTGLPLLRVRNAESLRVRGKLTSRAEAAKL